MVSSAGLKGFRLTEGRRRDIGSQAHLNSLDSLIRASKSVASYCGGSIKERKENSDASVSSTNLCTSMFCSRSIRTHTMSINQNLAPQRIHQSLQSQARLRVLPESRKGSTSGRFLESSVDGRAPLVLSDLLESGLVVDVSKVPL